MASKTIQQVIEIVTKNQDKLDELVKQNQNYQKSAGETDKSNKSLAQSFFFVANNAKMIINGLKSAISMLHNYASAADEVGKASQRLGVSLEFYQKLESAAGHAGTSVNAFVGANRKLLMNLQSIQEGSKKTVRVYNELGVSVRNASGDFKSQEELLTETLIALADMEDKTKRNSLAQETLGRSAMELNPLLDEGAEAIRKYISENDSAVKVSEDMAEASKRYNDAMLTISETIKKDFNEALTPAVEGVAELLESMLETGVVDNFGKSIAALVEPLNWVTQGADLFWKALHGQDKEASKEAQAQIDEILDKSNGLKALEKARVKFKKEELDLYIQFKKAEEERDDLISKVHSKDYKAANEKYELLKDQFFALDDQTGIWKKLIDFEEQYNGKLHKGLQFEKEIAAIKKAASKTTTKGNGSKKKGTGGEDEEYTGSAVGAVDSVSHVEMVGTEKAKEHYLNSIKEKKDAALEFALFMDDLRKKQEQRLLDIQNIEMQQAENRKNAYLNAASQAVSAIETIANARQKATDKWLSKELDAINSSRLSEKKKEQERLKAEKKAQEETKKGANIAWAATSSLAMAEAALSVIDMIRRFPSFTPAGKIAAGAVIGATTFGLAAQVASSKPKFYNGGEVPSNGFSGDSQLAMVRSGERVLTPSENRAYKVDQNRVTNNNSTANNVTINADFKGSSMAEIQRALPDLVAKGIEQADRQNKIDYTRLTNFNRAVRA